MTIQDKKEQLEKLKAIYELAKSHYDEETDRFRKLDDKTARLFSFLVIMIGGFGFFGKWLLDTIKYPGTWWDLALLLIGLLVAVVLLASGGFTLMALWTMKLDKPASDLETLKFLSTQPLKTVYILLAKSFVTALETNRGKTSRKTFRLTLSYYSVTAAMILFVILVGLFTWHTLRSKYRGPVDFHPHGYYNCVYQFGKDDASKMGNNLISES